MSGHQGLIYHEESATLEAPFNTISAATEVPTTADAVRDYDAMNHNYNQAALILVPATLALIANGFKRRKAQDIETIRAEKQEAQDRTLEYASRKRRND